MERGQILFLLRHRRQRHAAAGADRARPRRTRSRAPTARSTRAGSRAKFDFLRAPRHRPLPAGRQRHHQRRPDPRHLGGDRGDACPTWSRRRRARRGAASTAPELLAELFNAAATGIAVGGTSGKSTVTGMIGWILHAGRPRPDGDERRGDEEFRHAPTRRSPARWSASGDAFVSEVDESDGSIALYRPEVAVLNNITLDHKSLDELRHLFRDFAAQGGDGRAQPRRRRDPPARRGAAARAAASPTRFDGRGADLFGSDIVEAPFAISLHRGRTAIAGPACRSPAATMSRTRSPRSPPPRRPACRSPRPPRRCRLHGPAPPLRAGRRGERRHA